MLAINSLQDSLADEEMDVVHVEFVKTWVAAKFSCECFILLWMGANGQNNQV